MSSASRRGRKTASKCLVAVSLLSIAGWSVANRRGLELLKANLTTAQLNDFMTYRRFDVVGGVSGRVYRIRYAGTMNVKELDRNGRCVRRLCFYPEGLVHGDIVLAQKAALEAFETETLAIANKYPPLLGRA
jgi:hypothetical protein